MDAGSREARRDHPRGCGEHWLWAVRSILTRGSSPRMRGAHCHILDMHIARGIIPADAGSTHAPTSKRFRPWDHPRGCGEHMSSPVSANP